MWMTDDHCACCVQRTTSVVMMVPYVSDDWTMSDTQMIYMSTDDRCVQAEQMSTMLV